MAAARGPPWELRPGDCTQSILLTLLRNSTPHRVSIGLENPEPRQTAAHHCPLPISPGAVTSEGTTQKPHDKHESAPSLSNTSSAAISPALEAQPCPCAPGPPYSRAKRLWGQRHFPPRAGPGSQAETGVPPKRLGACLLPGPRLWPALRGWAALR